MNKLQYLIDFESVILLKFIKQTYFCQTLTSEQKERKSSKMCLLKNTLRFQEIQQKIRKIYK